MAEFIYSFNKKSLSGYKNYNTDSLFSGEICIEWACVVVLYGKAVGTMACSGKMPDTEFLCVRLYIYKINIQYMNPPWSACVIPWCWCRAEVGRAVSILEWSSERGAPEELSESGHRSSRAFRRSVFPSVTRDTLAGIFLLTSHHSKHYRQVFFSLILCENISKTGALPFSFLYFFFSS